MAACKVMVGSLEYCQQCGDTKKEQSAPKGGGGGGGGLSQPNII